MPLVTYHLVADQFSDEQCMQLLLKGAELYAEVLDSPVQRIRSFINTYPASKTLVAGKVLSSLENGAPFFEFIVLAGRPKEQTDKLMAGFTDLIESLLNVERSLIRGRCIKVEPSDWGIAGRSAADQRSNEIAARKEQQAAS